MPDRDEVLADLEALGRELRAATRRADRLYAKRIQLLLDGRRCQPPLTMAAMAGALGQSQKAVDQALVAERRRRRAVGGE